MSFREKFFDDVEALIQAIREGFNPQYLFFWGHQSKVGTSIGKSCLSQWYPAPFQINNLTYLTAEHYMMAEKARLFNDQVIVEKILKAICPQEVKALGREIKHFDEAQWREQRSEIVIQGNLAKFAQNPLLKHFLLKTANQVLVEASPVDKIWGIGLAENDLQIQDPEKWLGLNLLGFALMKVRRRLKG
ncbi:NADAR domain-containing protein [Candidatus Berkiella aquae]|uniref:NADAR family protein n=1 Tax=Candidatus Berkiella aquae TaxID=295108 RepID=A0A0Q9YIT9_9GAMM|nr:NADAR family protein [Candidatus Berkiella aquae]MCS5712180.1 NADAR family protein [Candidatus Berkiella aquae]